jgi:hypothetical protein
MCVDPWRWRGLVLKRMVRVLSRLKCPAPVAFFGGWTSRAVRLISVEFSLYQQSIRAFASVRVTSSFTVDGEVKTSIKALAFPLFTVRYQPSIVFEITVGLMILLQVRRNTVEYPPSALTTADLPGVRCGGAH